MQTLLVDDNQFNRQGVRWYLEGHGYTILEAGDEATAWEVVTTRQPEVVVLDIVLPKQPDMEVVFHESVGIELAQRIKICYPDLGIVMFSAHEDRGSGIWELLYQGYRGLAYKMKGSPPPELLQAMRVVQQGGVLIDPEVTDTRNLYKQTLARLTPTERPFIEQALARLGDLSDLEYQVASRLAAAHSYKKIAAELQLAPKTIENYVGHAYHKLGLHEADKSFNKGILLAKAWFIQELRQLLGDLPAKK